MPGMPLSNSGEDADWELCLLLGLSSVPRGGSPETGRLLRVLFVRVRRLPIQAAILAFQAGVAGHNPCLRGTHYRMLASLMLSRFTGSLGIQQHR